MHGVGFLVSPKAANAITAVTPVSELIIPPRVEAKPKAINIIQVYFRTSDADDDDIRQMYAIVQDRIADCSKKERLIVVGDFNAKIGEDTCRQACGKFGLGELNNRGLTLLDWLEDNKLIAVDTCFRHRFSKKFTWTSPGGRYHNQIDYITMQSSDLRECEDSRALCSADCGSGHQIVRSVLKERAGLSKERRLSERRDC